MARYNKIQCSGKAYAPKAKKLPKVLGNKPRPPKKKDPSEQITINQHHKNIKPYIDEALEELLEIAGTVIGEKINKSACYCWGSEIELCDVLNSYKLEDWLGTSSSYRIMADFCEKWENKIPGIEGTKKFSAYLNDYALTIYYEAKTFKPIEQAAAESQKYEKAYASYEKRLAAWEEAKAAGVKTKKELADEAKAQKLLARKAQLEKELKELGV